MSTRAFSLLCLATLALTARGAIPIAPVAGSYSYEENFDTMFAPAAAGAVTSPTERWADGGTVPGWYFHYSTSSALTPAGVFAGASFIYSGNDGSAAPILTLNSQGAAGSTDRAFATPSASARCEQSGIVVFQNTSSLPVNLSRIRYDGEVLRTNSAANTTESIHVYYRMGDSETELLTITSENLNLGAAAAKYGDTEIVPTAGNYLTGWTEVTEAIFTYFTRTAATQLNLVQPVDSRTLSGIRVEPGKFIALRVAQPNDAGTDALMGIDNLRLDFTEPDMAVSAAVSSVVRDDNGSPRNPLDDSVSFVLNVTGSGAAGPGWCITSPAPLATSGNSLGVPKQFTGVPISEFTGAGHTLSGTVFDATHPDVTVNFMVAAPWAAISATAGNFVRLPGADPDSPYDDEFSWNLLVSGSYTSPQWEGIFSGLTITGVYDTDDHIFPSRIPTLVEGNADYIGQVGPFTVHDSQDPGVTTPNLYLVPPMIIGVSTLHGVPEDILSDGMLITGDASQITWANNAALHKLQMTDGDRANAGPTPKKVTATVNLAGVSGPVQFSMQLMAIDVSSGFESVDTFAARLIYHDGVSELPPVNLVTQFHETQTGFAGVPDGVLAGFELVSAGNGFPITNSFQFSQIIPDNIQSARLEIEAICDSGYTSERMEVTNIRFAAAQPGIIVSPATNIVRHENGNGPADDTLTFDLTLTGAIASAGWVAEGQGLSPSSGAYGSYSFTVSPELPPNDIIFRFKDAGDPSLTTTLVFNVPQRRFMALRNFGSGLLEEVCIALNSNPSPIWVNDSFLHTFTLNAGLLGQTETVVSENLDLRAVGPVRFTGKLGVTDTSTSSNFERLDKFRAELIVDAGLPTQNIIDLTTPYDTGDGSSAVPFLKGLPAPNGPPDGWINGYNGTASAADGFPTFTSEYDAHRSRDEFNFQRQSVADTMSAELTFSAIISAAASSVQLRILSQGISGTETAVFKDALFELYTPPAIVPAAINMPLTTGVSGKISASATALLATGGAGLLSVLSVQSGPTARGGSVTLEGGWIIYEPAAGTSGVDTFTYTLTDGIQSATGSVTILIGPPGGATHNLVGIIPEGTGNRIGGMGIPGRLYQWQTASDMQNWSPLAPPSTCPANGAMSVLDPGPLPQLRFYRLIEVGQQ